MTTSKISVFLRGATDELSKVLRDNGFLTVPPERETELAAILEKFNEEMYGAPSSSSPRRKQTDVRVISEIPVVYDRDYLTKQSVQELLRIAKAKGCKNLGPRKKESLIEKLLQHLTSPPLATEAEQSNSEASSQASDITAATDDELRPEPVPAAPTSEETKEKKPRKKKEPTDEPAPVVLTGDAPEPAKKPRKKKEKSEEDSQVVPTGDAPAPAVKKERKKKEKSDEPKAERKKKAPAEEEKQEKEDEEEVTIAVRSWIHPKEQDKPPAERTRYCIDPITNNIYNPDQLTDEPIGRWDDETQEIIPF